MVSYEETEKILFAADAFGSFGALDGILFNDEVNFDRDWLDDARRYYSNIVGKYGSQVQAALKKLSALDIQTICRCMDLSGELIWPISWINTTIGVLTNRKINPSFSSTAPCTGTQKTL